jgi:hypothetical protein
MHKRLRKTPALLFTLGALALVAISFYPLADDWLARRATHRTLDRVAAEIAGARRAGLELPPLQRLRCGQGTLRLVQIDPPLASWGNVGGCGAGGGAGGGTGGCPKWVGRGVSGGLLDVQTQACPGLAKGNVFNTFNTRFGTSALFQKWSFGLTVPLLYKIGDVQVPTSTLGVTNEEQAQIAGFGDIGLEITRKLGITNSHMVTLTINAPTGSYDAIRQGVFLPPQLQLGSGVLGLSGLYEYTMDRDWGFMLFGANAGYSGWENSVGGFRGSSAGGYVHLGYLLGPFVATAGVTLTGKFEHDREHDPDYGPDEQVSLARSNDDDPLLLITPDVGIEWSTDYLALLLTAAPTLSYNGYDGISFSLGLQTSLF